MEITLTVQELYDLAIPIIEEQRNVKIKTGNWEAFIDKNSEGYKKYGLLRMTFICPTPVTPVTTPAESPERRLDPNM
jgi:hypothetical protein